MQVTLLPIPGLALLRHAIEPMLEPACAVTHGRYTTADVFRLCEAGKMLMWIAFEQGVIHGCQVTQVIEYPSKRVLCSLFTAGRRLREWREPMMDLLQRYARDAQCAAIEGQGREGWVKMLEPWGARPMAILFEKEL